jgi:hypothetical protein
MTARLSSRNGLCATRSVDPAAATGSHIRTYTRTHTHTHTHTHVDKCTHVDKHTISCSPSFLHRHTRTHTHTHTHTQTRTHTQTHKLTQVRSSGAAAPGEGQGVPLPAPLAARAVCQPDLPEGLPVRLGALEQLQVTLLLHCCYTVITLLLHCCYTVVTLLSHSCCTVVTLFLHCCYTVSVTCGQGRRTRLQKVVKEASLGGLRCAALKTEAEQCTLRPCPRTGRDCEVSAWSEWAECDSLCETQRFREVTKAGTEGGLRCPSLVERSVCKTAECNGNFEGSCKGHCGGLAPSRYTHTNTHRRTHAYTHFHTWKRDHSHTNKHTHAHTHRCGCDATCVRFGDCCEDFQYECSDEGVYGGAECVGNCGQKGQSGTCWCDTRILT